MSNPSDFIIENGILKEYKGPGGDVVIPEGVTEIGGGYWSGAFSGCTNLTGVSFPKSLKSIGTSAFKHCSSLVSLTLPDGLTKIGESAFYKCGSLSSIALPDSLTSIEPRAFYSCSSLTSVVLPESVVCVRAEVFSGCSSLTKVDLPARLTCIEEDAFSRCSALTSIILPESVSSIGKAAFCGCSSLKSITLPENLTSIGDSAFLGCSNLKSITLPESIQTIGSRAFYGCDGISIQISDSAANRPDNYEIYDGVLKKYHGPGGNVVVPDCVSSIGAHAFSECETLTGIVLPENVTNIGDRAFYNCSRMASISLSESMRSIGNEAFSGCCSITSISLPKDVAEIGDQAFRRCIGLADRNGLITENDVVFDYVGSGGDLIIPEGVLRISGWTFERCTNLTSISLPDSLQWIGDHAFDGCSALKRISFPDSISELGLGDFVFQNCTNLENVTLPKGLTKLPDCAFRMLQDDSRLSSVFLPDGMTAIGDSAFSGCSSLKIIHIPDSILSFGSWAFQGCKGLADDNGFVIVQGTVYDYFGRGGAVTVPQKATKIGANAFYNCGILKTVILQNAVACIETSAFEDCKNLKSIAFSDTLSNIEPRAFCNCRKLLEVTLPRDLSVIRGESFRNCAALKTVVLPDKLSCIEADAFKGCNSLTDIILPEGHDLAWLADIDEKGQMCKFYPNMDDLCRAANEMGFTHLVTQSKKWNSGWKKLFFASYLHSDTRAAMLLAEKRKELAQYAAMRGLKEDEVRDCGISDLGLDENRCKKYDLGNQIVTLRLLSDFTFAIELPDKSVVMDLPKKNADAEKYKKAAADLSQMKKDVRSIWNNRADLLLGEYVSGKERSVSYWTRLYGGNPILHGVASLLVWEQGGAYFTRTDKGLIRNDGSVYELVDSPIRVAHPMEMEKQEREAWQRYFASRGLKQPFAQVWERVYTKEEIAPDRYAGCPILFFALQGAAEHGFDEKLEIPGCKIKAEWISRPTANGKTTSYCDIQVFEIKQFTRAVNHAIAWLDRTTVLGRIRKDDLTVMDYVQGCNVAQITDFIAAAQEANAANVLAALLDYKNANFSDFDPMDEFTLEW